MPFKQTAILLAILIGSSACDLINPEEQVPCYIQVDAFTLDIPAEDVDQFGADSQNITDVWLFANDILVGAFELPALIPVLEEGMTNIKAFPGIKVNGIGNFRETYRFYDFHEENLELIPTSSLVIDPVVRYVDAPLAIDKENFEDIGFQFVRSVGSDTTIIRINNPDPDISYLSENVGAIYTTSEKSYFKIQTTMQLNLAFENPVFVELDYKTDKNFFFGLKSIFPSAGEVGLVGIIPKLDSDGDPIWNKIYIDISDAIALLGNGTVMEVFLEGDNNGTEGFLFIDNVKIIRPS